MSVCKFISSLIILVMITTGCANDNAKTNMGDKNNASIKPTLQQEKTIDRQINLVIKSLGLDSIEAAKFRLPYKEYRLEKFATNESIRSLIGDKDVETMADADYRNFIIQSKKGKIKNTDLEIKYIGIFSEVLSIRKVGQLFMIEQKLMERLMNTKRENIKQTAASPKDPAQRAERQKKAMERLKEKRKIGGK